MKILEDRYPMGSLPGQKTPGRYIDGILKNNIDLLAKNIIKDITYLGIISSSTLEVGTGKSVFVQQLAEAYLDAVNKYHGFNLKLTMNNIVFRPQDIIERSFRSLSRCLDQGTTTTSPLFSMTFCSRLRPRITSL